MNYKALEDLINILVKKSGTELKSDVIKNEIKRLEEKKNKVLNEKNIFEETITNKEYIDYLGKEKDLSEKEFLDKAIEELEKELSDFTKEDNSFNKVLESGETYFDSLVIELKKLYFDFEACIIKDSSSEEVLQIKKSIKAKEKEIIRKKSVEEEITRIICEINSLKEQLKVVSKKIEVSLYEDNLQKISDENTLATYSKEIELINNSLNVWNSSPELIGAKILDAFKEKKDIDLVKEEIEVLLNFANTELRKTQKEVNGSNIFEVMDKYEHLVLDKKDKIGSDTYASSEESKLNDSRITYHKDKVNKYENSLLGISERKEEVLNLISVSRNLFEDAKASRLNIESKLFCLENKLFETNTEPFADEAIKEIDKLIIAIKEDIDNCKVLENEYISDVYSYKEELKNLSINHNTLVRQIEKENKILDILNSRIDENGMCTNNIEKLNDKLYVILSENRLRSLKNQQQYLYVDTRVIKEEINNLWTRSISSPVVEEIEKKAVIGESKLEDQSEANNEMNIDEDIEILDDWGEEDIKE